MSRLALAALCAAPLPLSFLALAFLPAPTTTWTPGAPAWSSVGALACGPDDVLFVADPRGAALFAVRTGQPDGDGPDENLSIRGFDVELAGLLGVETADLTIQDLVVDPRDGSAYLSVTRTAGEEETPLIVRAFAPDGLELVELAESEHQRAALSNVAEEGNRRAQSVTDLEFVDGQLFVAGLSNEEFASKLRVLPFPFDEVGAGTSVEIYHGAHGAWETQAPVRAFAALEIEGEPHLVAAYTCTPLVKIPLAKIEPGVKITGTTVAELGSGNRPLDLVPYERDGERFLLISNSHRGVMKVSTAGIEEAEAITEHVAGGKTAGLTYETIDYLQGVMQLASYDDERVLVLIGHDTGGMDLETIDLP